MIRRMLQVFRKPKGKTPAERMMTLQRAPVYYLHIAKNGSTFLKNLFYYLDHQTVHPAGDDIHGASELLRAKARDAEKIRQSDYAFAVIRDPVDRFMSLYFEKIYNDSPRNFPDLREYFTREIQLDLSEGLSAEAHRQNCFRLIDWIGENLAHRTDQPVNSHWRRQSSRLKRVKELELELLTLDGLDWQLPLFVGDLLPDIREAMAAVKSRNVSRYPVDRLDVLNDELRSKIEEIYSRDKRIYDRTSLKWHVGKSNSVDDRPLSCFTSSKHPINCVVPLKSGRTFIRNLFYVLENGERYHSPLKIHDKDLSSVSLLSKEQLENEVSFFVIRNPTDRFFSLYFDKVYADGEQAFPWIKERLIKFRGYVEGQNLSIGEHQSNCLAFLGYLERKFETESMAEMNPHWRPQIETVAKAIGLGLKPLLLEDLDNQLLQIADGKIDGLEQAIKSMPDRNSSIKPYSTAEILTPEIARRISALYGDDQALYERVKVGWRKTGQPPIL